MRSRNRHGLILAFATDHKPQINGRKFEDTARISAYSGQESAPSDLRQNVLVFSRMYMLLVLWRIREERMHCNIILAELGRHRILHLLHISTKLSKDAQHRSSKLFL